MTNKITLALCAFLLLWGCGSSTSDEAETSDNKEHFLSDQQRALESAKTAAGAVEAAAAKAAEDIEKLRKEN